MKFLPRNSQEKIWIEREGRRFIIIRDALNIFLAFSFSFEMIQIARK